MPAPKPTFGGGRIGDVATSALVETGAMSMVRAAWGKGGGGGGGKGEGGGDATQTMACGRGGTCASWEASDESAEPRACLVAILVSTANAWVPLRVMLSLPVDLNLDWILRRDLATWIRVRGRARDLEA